METLTIQKESNKTASVNKHSSLCIPPPSYKKWSIVEYEWNKERICFQEANTVYTINSIPIRLSEKEIFENLQNGDSSSVSRRTKTQTRKAIKAVLAHGSPQGLYRILPIRRKNGFMTFSDDPGFRSKNLKNLFRLCDRVVIFLTTMGKEIDDLIEKTMAKSSTYGYLVNLAAAAAAEAAASYLQQHITDILPEDETTTYRYSPGYCDWSLREQKKLFGMIPHCRIGVELSENSLMTPSKSVSGLFGICPADTDLDLTNLCRQCHRKNCPYRRI